jgi:hypothetical protein
MLFTVVAALLFVLPGCKKKDDAAGQPPAAEPAPSEPGVEPSAADEPQEGKAAVLRNKMKHCPNSVEGVTTSYEKTATALVIKMSHEDAAKLAEIKDRAEHLASVAGKPEPELKHSGQGTGGGTTGQCPVGIKNTKVTVAEVDGKIAVTLEPLDGTTVDRLYSEATARQAKLHETAGQEHGSGKGGGSGGGGGKGAGAKSGGAGKAAQDEGHEHGTGTGVGHGGGGKGAASGDKDGKPSK